MKPHVKQKFKAAQAPQNAGHILQDCASYDMPRSNYWPKKETQEAMLYDSTQEFL